jgi:hypothetical protein
VSTEVVTGARASLESARAELDSAAVASLAARAAFLAGPCEFTEAALESAERVERKAARYVEAREAQLQEAEQSQRAAERAESQAELARLESERRALRRVDLKRARDRLSELCEQLEVVVTDIERTVATDQTLFARATRIARPYGLRVDLAVLDLTIVRTAFSLHLGVSWQAPKGSGSSELPSFYSALARFSLPGTALNAVERFRLAHSELLAETQAPEHADWVRLEMNPVNPLSAAHHSRVRAAARLLAELEEVAP